MSPKQVDKLIKSGKPVTLKNTVYNEVFTAIIVSRDRWTITTKDGGRFERDELEVVTS